MIVLIWTQFKYLYITSSAGCVRLTHLNADKPGAAPTGAEAVAQTDRYYTRLPLAASPPQAAAATSVPISDTSTVGSGGERVPGGSWHGCSRGRCGRNQQRAEKETRRKRAGREEKEVKRELKQ